MVEEPQPHEGNAHLKYNKDGGGGAAGKNN